MSFRFSLYLYGEHGDTHWIDGNAGGWICSIRMVCKQTKHILMSQVWTGCMFKSGQDVMRPGMPGQGS